LLFENSENLVKQIDMFQNRMEQIRNTVLKKDKSALIENFKKSGDRREGIS
jgi:prephenate dehydrogenase